VFLLVGTARGNPVDDFLQAMQQDIVNNNVSTTSVFITSSPPDSLGIEVLWGYCYWPDSTRANYTWVRAQAVDSPAIAGWSFTTWSDLGVPRRYDIYKHGRGMPQPVAPGHRYYIRALHWIPGDHEDFPARNQNPPSPPSWADGMVNSPTYKTAVWYSGTTLQQDVVLSGPIALW
jgi:hypothetical protein